MVAPESFRGSTSRFCRVRQGVLLKYPVEVWRESSAYQKLTDEIANNFSVERQILDLLGEHPRIVSSRGLLLAEASHGSLQRYLDENNDTGVINSDLRPENFLVHATTSTSLDLWLCDFGGSTCEELGLDGKHLPDPGFFDPNSEWVSTPATDIFSVGSILYTIVTGHWPHRGPGPFKNPEDMEIYDQHVEDLFRQSKFPDVEGLFGGRVMLCCWTSKYTSADDVLRALDLEMTTSKC
ncbi:hypothetical protein GE09DRAFT_1180164 [Coniochaeta sp. 2T2.1]|nr:hypothetical protein GE09DRAFT_1180164 [Coniochaeta sp. 2T2.1]